MNALPVEKPVRMNVGAFLDWPGDGTRTRYDLVAGEPVAQAAPAEEHGVIQANVATLLNMALRSRPPCRVIAEMGVYKSRRHHNFRRADLAVTCAPPVRGELSPPTVIIEILSPSNRQQTLNNLAFYATFESVQEIVTIDSERAQVLVYRRGGPDWDDNPAATLGPGDRLELRSIDVALDLTDIYRNVPL